MDISEHLDTPGAPEVLFAWVEDLVHYPDWLDIVPRADRIVRGASVETDGPEVEPDGSEEPAWVVDLRGRLGPLARSKRLRMVRSECQAPSTVTFERREHDGRAHAAWVLRAEVTPTDRGSRLTMHLHYGGSLWGPVLEHLLRDEIGNSRERLLACVASGPPRTTA